MHLERETVLTLKAGINAKDSIVAVGYNLPVFDGKAVGMVGGIFDFETVFCDRICGLVRTIVIIAAIGITGGGGGLQNHVIVALPVLQLVAAGMAGGVEVGDAIQIPGQIGDDIPL